MKFPLSLLMVVMLSSTALGQVPDTARPVVSEIVTSVSANLRSFPGLIRSAQEVNLAFLAAGRLESRPVNLGDRVKASDLVARLNQTSLEEDAAAARAALQAAKAQAQIAQQSYTRAQELHRRGVAPQSSLEAAQAAMQTSAANALAAQEAVTRAEDAASYATLLAPQDGVITAILAEPGTTVTAGQPIATLASDGAREAVIDIPADYLPLLQPQAKFRILPRNTGNMDASQAQSGTLRLIEPVADAGARMHRLRIALEDDSLRLGSLVTVQLDFDESPMLSLPQSAVMQTENGEAQVWRITPDRTLEAVPIALGPVLDGRVIVTRGISPGDEILTKGASAAQAGQSVGERITP